MREREQPSASEEIARLEKAIRQLEKSIKNDEALLQRSAGSAAREIIQDVIEANRREIVIKQHEIERLKEE